jgi:negative regulator of replication initiation
MSNPALLATKLDELATSLKQQPSKVRFSDQYGWPTLPLNVDDLAILATNLAERIKTLKIESPDSELRHIITRLNESVESVKNTLVPNIFSNAQAPETVIGLFYAIENFLAQAVGDTDFKVVAGIAARLRSRASTASDRIESVFAEMEGIEQKLSLIQRAHDAAEDLPITQKELRDAVTAAEALQKAVVKSELAASTSATEAAAAESKLKQIAEAAEVYLGKIKGSYRAVTSQGLAQAFSDRQVALHRSMLIWVLGLMAALAIAGLIARERFPELVATLKGTPDWGIVIVNVTFAALSLSPAVWFAWVATTQIGQRFRLAEDYAYKAAISAAYEGYRSEAANLDPLLEAQLFSSALGRLDELPLRLIDSKVTGSPLHELLKSVEFKQAADAVPDLMDKVFSILRRTPAGKNGAKTVENVAPRDAL